MYAHEHNVETLRPNPFPRYANRWSYYVQSLFYLWIYCYPCWTQDYISVAYAPGKSTYILPIIYVGHPQVILYLITWPIHLFFLLCDSSSHKKVWLKVDNSLMFGGFTCVSELGCHWFRQSLVACSVPNQCLNQCPRTDDWSNRDKRLRNCTQTQHFSFQKGTSNHRCKMAAISSRSHCVNLHLPNGVLSEVTFDAQLQFGQNPSYPE